MKTRQILSATAMAAVMAVAASSAYAADMPMKESMEKCYGVVKAGKNDCKSNAHSCAGHAANSGDADEFIMVPQGLCEKLASGILKANEMPMEKMEK